MHLLKMYLFELYLILSSRLKFLLCSSKQVEFITKPESFGLFVLLSGLNAHPSHWKKYVKEIGEGYDLFVPFIYKRGNCNLEEAVEPLFQQLKNYNKPICLIGHSNGARIAYALELLFRHLGSKIPIMVITLSDVPLGTQLANSAARFSKSPAYKKLSFRHPELLTFLGQLQEKLPPGVIRKYLRFASKNDPFLTKDTTFVPLYKNEKDVWIEGQVHATLMHAVVKEAVEAGKEFLCATR